MPAKFPIATNASPPSIGTHTQALRCGDFVFLTAQNGRHPATGVLPEGVEAQTHQVLENVDAILNAAGCSRADIVRVTLMMADLKDFKAIDAIYAAWLPDRGVAPLPVRTPFVAKTLPAHSLVTIEVTAAIPSP